MTNQLATKLLTVDHKPANFDTVERAVLMPQLGDSWTAPKTMRLALFRSSKEGIRYASISQGDGTASRNRLWSSFSIDEAGVARDIETPGAMCSE